MVTKQSDLSLVEFSLRLGRLCLWMLLPLNALRPLTGNDSVSGTVSYALSFPCALALRVPFGFRDLPRSGPILRYLLLSETAPFIALCVFTAAAQRHLRSSLG